MSKFRQGGKPSRPMIVTSTKKRKTEARLANEYGIQRQKAVKIALERAEELDRAISPSSELQDIVAVAREAAWSQKRRDEEAVKRFQRKPVEPEATSAPEAADTVDLLGEDDPAYPVTTDWAAEEERYYTPETGWKCAIVRLKNGSREVLSCPHKHKNAETARGCAIREAMGRNKHSDWSDSVWSPDARYPWTDGRVSALIDELRAE